MLATIAYFTLWLLLIMSSPSIPIHTVESEDDDSMNAVTEQLSCLATQDDAFDSTVTPSKSIIFESSLRMWSNRFAIFRILHPLFPSILQLLSLSSSLRIPYPPLVATP